MPAAAEGVAGLLAYDRDAVASGEAWRLVTSLAMHWSWVHAAADGFLIALLSLAIARREGRRVLLALAGFAIVTQAAALAGLSGAAHYRGSSGIAWALGAFALVRMFEGRWRAKAAAAAGLTAFAVAPPLLGASAVLPAGVLPDPAMHLAGALAGSAFAFAQARCARVSISSLLRFT